MNDKNDVWDAAERDRIARMVCKNYYVVPKERLEMNKQEGNAKRGGGAQLSPHQGDTTQELINRVTQLETRIGELEGVRKKATVQPRTRPSLRGPKEVEGGHRRTFKSHTQLYLAVDNLPLPFRYSMWSDDGTFISEEDKNPLVRVL